MFRTYIVLTHDTNPMITTIKISIQAKNATSTSIKKKNDLTLEMPFNYYYQVFLVL